MAGAKHPKLPFGRVVATKGVNRGFPFFTNRKCTFPMIDLIGFGSQTASVEAMEEFTPEALDLLAHAYGSSRPIALRFPGLL